MEGGGGGRGRGLESHIGQTHTHTHARTHARTDGRSLARTHAHTHTHTHTLIPLFINEMFLTLWIQTIIEVIENVQYDIDVIYVKYRAIWAVGILKAQ